MEFFGTQNKVVSVDDIATWLQESMIDCEIESDQEDFPGDWEEITLFLESGDSVVEIEKITCDSGNFREAIEETVRTLLDDQRPVRPASAVKWICQYMKSVKVIYRFRPMPGIDTELGFELFNEVWTRLKNIEPGIVHCVDEGFTNEDGAQITWEFPESSSGTVKAAVLEAEGGSWREFQLDLANQEQQSSFLAGKCP